ncbi:MAG: PadR family transcriptional regulator [Bacteroidota bacterium]
MNAPSLGNLEETILLLMLTVKEEKYGFSVAEAYRQHLNKSISIPAIHTVLKRLEKKGLVSSKMGGATAARGGRKKRLYEVTAYGKQVLVSLRDTRAALWKAIPPVQL